MINKKYMNYLKKELKKEKCIMIKYLPTEEEKEYLKIFNIYTEVRSVTQKGLISEYGYETDYCIYYLKK